MSAADWLTSDAVSEALARIKRENEEEIEMSARQAIQIEQARLTVTTLTFALRNYASYPLAAARVEAQLDAAQRRLAELEGGAE